MVRIGRPFGDAFVSVAALVMLLGVLVAVDGRVREQVSLRMKSGDARAQLVAAGAQLRDFTSVVAQVARDKSIEHAPLMIFAFASTMLVIFMLRM